MRSTDLPVPEPGPGEVLIEEGMAVKEGQLLARLDDTTTRPIYALSQRQLEAARKNLNEVEVRVAEAERNLRRTQQLRQDKLVSELQLVGYTGVLAVEHEDPTMSQIEGLRQAGMAAGATHPAYGACRASS